MAEFFFNTFQLKKLKSLKKQPPKTDVTKFKTVLVMESEHIFSE